MSNNDDYYDRLMRELMRTTGAPQVAAVGRLLTEMSELQRKNRDLTAKVDSQRASLFRAGHICYQTARDNEGLRHELAEAQRRAAELERALANSEAENAALGRDLGYAVDVLEQFGAEVVYE